jgi:hypothetical protein
VQSPFPARHSSISTKSIHTFTSYWPTSLLYIKVSQNIWNFIWRHQIISASSLLRRLRAFLSTEHYRTWNCSIKCSAYLPILSAIYRWVYWLCTMKFEDWFASHKYMECLRYRFFRKQDWIIECCSLVCAALFPSWIRVHLLPSPANLRVSFCNNTPRIFSFCISWPKSRLMLEIVINALALTFLVLEFIFAATAFLSFKNLEKNQ